MKKFSEMSYDDLEKHVEEAIKALRQRAYGEGYKQGRFDVDIEGTYGKQEETKSPQQIRDEIVAKAKADVVELAENGFAKNKFGDKRLVEFIVNKEKRTVVVLLRGYLTGLLYAKGIAKADPSDCFNSAIGKAIALRRALGLEVPAEYYNVPAPTEVRVGDVIKYARRIATVVSEDSYSGGYGETRVGTAKHGKIIDDSRSEENN